MTIKSPNNNNTNKILYTIKISALKVPLKGPRGKTKV